ncbi:MAG: PEP-CTERM sorting domain-containing protein [Rhizomicrobium sp.]
MKTKFWLSLVAGAAMAGLFTTSANATFLGLRVTSAATNQNTSTTFAGTTGNISLSGTINNVTYSLNGTGVDAGGLTSLLLQLPTSTDNTNSLRTVKYAITMTGIAVQPNLESWTSLLTGLNALNGPPPAVSNAGFQVYYSESNVAYSTQHLLYDSGFVCGAAAAYSCANGGAFPTPTGTYSLTEILTVTYKPGSQGQNVSTSASFAAIPEPTSIALLGSGLLLLGWLSRRGKKRSDIA